MGFAVFDLDDTLGCTKHRRRFIIPPGKDYADYVAPKKGEADAEGFKPDWDAFFEARYDDTPIWPVVELFHALNRTGTHVEIWTAAREDSRDLTRAWLNDKCGIPHTKLRHMRPIEDYRKSVVLKEEWILKAPVRPTILFDDHIGVIRMARSHGILGFAVGENEY